MLKIEEKEFAGGIMDNIILASASPRRKELLQLAGVSFTVLPATGEEQISTDIPWEAVEQLSFQKAQMVAESHFLGRGNSGYRSRYHRCLSGKDTWKAKRCKRRSTNTALPSREYSSGIHRCDSFQKTGWPVAYQYVLGMYRCYVLPGVFGRNPSICKNRRANG